MWFLTNASAPGLAGIGQQLIVGVEELDRRLLVVLRQELAECLTGVGQVGRSAPEHLVRDRGRLATELAEIALLRLDGRLVLQLGLDLAFDRPQVAHRHLGGRRFRFREHPVGQLRVSALGPRSRP